VVPHCPTLYCLFAVLLIATVIYFEQINDDDDDEFISEPNLFCIKPASLHNKEQSVCSEDDLWTFRATCRPTVHYSTNSLVDIAQIFDSNKKFLTIITARGDEFIIVHCLVSKRPGGDLSRGRTVLVAKHLLGEPSRWRIVQGVKRPGLGAN